MNDALTELLDELISARNDLLCRMDEQFEKALNERPAEDTWSVGEVHHHLAIVDKSIEVLFVRQIQRAEKRGIGPNPHVSSIMQSLDEYDIERKGISSPVFQGAVPSTA